MERDYTQQIQQNQILLEKTASLVNGQLDLWTEQLNRLENLISPLNQSSKKIYIFQQNLFKLKEVADKLQDIEAENGKLLINLKKAYSAAQLKYYKQLNANLEYIRTKHPGYSVNKHEEAMRDFTQQILQRVGHLAEQFIAKGDFEAVRAMSSENLLLVSQQVKGIKARKLATQFAYFKSSCFPQHDPALAELAGIIRAFFLSHRQFIQVVGRVQRDFGQKFFWLIHSFQVWRDLLILSENFNTKTFSDQSEGNVHSLTAMSLYFEILKAVGLQPNVHSNLPSNEVEIQHIIKQHTTFTADFKAKRRLFASKADKIHIDEKKYQEMAYQTERNPLSALLLVFQAKTFQITQVFRSAVRQCLAEVLTGDTGLQSSTSQSKTFDTDQNQPKMSESNNNLQNKQIGPSGATEQAYLFDQQIELPEALEHLVLRFCQHVVASMIYPALENYLQLVSEYCRYGEKYRIRKSVYGMLDIVQILGITVPVFGHKLYPNIVDQNLLDNKNVIYDNQKAAQGKEEGNILISLNEQLLKQKFEANQRPNKNLQTELNTQPMNAGPLILNTLRRQPDVASFAQLGSIINVGKDSLQINQGNSYILLLISNIISNVTKSAVILQENLDQTLLPITYKPPTDMFVIPQVAMAVNLLFQLSYYIQAQKILAELIGFDNGSEYDRITSQGTSLQSIATKCELQGQQSAISSTNNGNQLLKEQQSPWRLPIIFQSKGSFQPTTDNITERRLYRLVCFALVIGINQQSFTKQKQLNMNSMTALSHKIDENNQNQNENNDQKNNKSGEKPIYSSQQLLQRVNTIAYIQDTLTTQGGVLASAISSQFKLEFLEQILNKLLSMYIKQLLNPCVKELKVQTLCVAIEHVYMQWAKSKRYGVDFDQVQQILKQLSTYRVQRDNLQLKKQKLGDKKSKVQKQEEQNVQTSQHIEQSQKCNQSQENNDQEKKSLTDKPVGETENIWEIEQGDDEYSLPSELSDDSIMTGIDLDQVTESNFSQFGTVPEHFQAQGQKLASKRIKSVIDQSINKFCIALKALKAQHNGFECVSPMLRTKMRKILMETLGNQLELFQNACYAVPVAQRYFEMQGFSLPQLHDFIDSLL